MTWPQLLATSAALSEEMRRLEEALRAVAVSSSNFNVSTPARPAGAVWSSGSSCVVVVVSLCLFLSLSLCFSSLVAPP